MGKFKPGDPKPPSSGRRKGVVNHATAEIRECAQRLLDEKYFEGLRKRLLSGQCAPALETMLFYYGFGKPRERIELDVSTPTQMDIAVARMIAERGREYIAAEKKKAKG